MRREQLIVKLMKKIDDLAIKVDLAIRNNNHVEKADEEWNIPDKQRNKSTDSGNGSSSLPQQQINQTLDKLYEDIKRNLTWCYKGGVEGLQISKDGTLINIHNMIQKYKINIPVPREDKILGGKLEGMRLGGDLEGKRLGVSSSSQDKYNKLMENRLR